MVYGMSSRISIAVAIALVVAGGVAIAAPRTQAKPAASSTAKAQLDKFAKEMGASFDQLLDFHAKAEAFETKRDLAGAIAQWTGVAQGARALRHQTYLAANAGAFQEPMRMPTKRGALAPDAFVAQLRKLQATGDARRARALVAQNTAQLAKSKVDFVTGMASQVASLEDSVSKLQRAPEAKAVGALALAKTLRGYAVAAKQQVTSAVKNKRADANARYPTRPKPSSGAEVAKRLDAVIASADQQIKRLTPLAEAVKKEREKRVAAASPSPSPRPGNGPAPTASSSAAATSSAATTAAPQVAPEEVPGQSCLPEGDTSCQDGALPCCDGLRCMVGGWYGYNSVDGESKPQYWECLNPELAPPRPTENGLVPQ